MGGAELFYAAAGDLLRWGRALASWAARQRVGAAALWSDGSNARRSLIAVGLDAAERRRWLDDGPPPSVPRPPPDARPGEIWAAARSCTLVLGRDNGHVSLASLPRARPRAMKALRELGPHLVAARELHERMSLLEHERCALAEHVDGQPDGMLVTDRRGFVLDRCGGATENGHSSLEVDRAGLLRCAKPSATEALLRLIGDGTPGVIRVGRNGGPPELLAQVVPLGAADDPLVLRPAAALVLLYEPTRDFRIDARAVASAWELSAAETRVAVELARGHDVTAICEGLRLSPNTVRTHLRRIFSKTATSRQASLVALLLAGPGTRRVRALDGAGDHPNG